MRERYIEDEVARFVRETKRLLNMLEIVLAKSPHPDRDELRNYAIAIANALETEIRELRYSLLDANVVTIDMTLADWLNEKSLVDAVLGMLKASPDDVVLLEYMSDGEVAYTTPPNSNLSEVIAEKLTAKLLPEDAIELTAMEMASKYYLIKVVGPTSSARYYLVKLGDQ
jgi:adenine C2-methylase RlmN of 23S rRNA A2503 and tRNA A37